MTVETYNKKITKVSERLAQLKEQIARSAVEFNGEEHILYRWENLNNQYLKLVEERTQLMDERLELLTEEMKRANSEPCLRNEAGKNLTPKSGKNVT